MSGTHVERIVYATLVLGVVIIVALLFLPSQSAPQALLFPREFAAAAWNCHVRTLTLNAPSAAEAAVSPADCRVRDMIGGSDDARAHPYQVTLREPGRLNLLLTSSQFDPFLIVYDPRRQTIVCQDDDSGGGNSALCVTPDLPAGSYLVLAKALAGRGGSYRLQAGFSSGRQAPGQVPGCRLNELALNLQVPGVLSAASCRLRQILGRGEDNSPAEQYRITVPQSGLLQIDLRSDAFDSHLTLLDSRSTEIATDDDSGGGRNARIARPVQAGTYTIVVKGLNQATGPYSLQTSFNALP